MCILNLRSEAKSNADSVISGSGSGHYYNGWYRGWRAGELSGRLFRQHHGEHGGAQLVVDLRHALLHLARALPTATDPPLHALLQQRIRHFYGVVWCVFFFTEGFHK